MRIATIASLVGAQMKGNADLRVEWLLTDSRSLCFAESTLFFAIRTECGDGHLYVHDLYQRGVRAFVVDTLQEGALVFLNETFQSTAYAEGAEGLCPILRHFGACGIRWILVSHLKDLPALLSPEEAEIRRTGAGYRIVPG